MGMVESDFSWIFSTTNSTAAVEPFDAKGYAQALSFYIESDSGCTATVQIHSRIGSSSGPYAVLSTTVMSTGAVTLVQFLGPMGWIKPHATSKSTGGLTVRLIGN
jgi:hypothetical protein